MPSGVRGGAVSKRLQPVRVGGRAVERVESQQRGPERKLRGRSPDTQSPVRLRDCNPVEISAEVMIGIADEQVFNTLI